MNIEKLDKNAIIPQRATPSSAGFDLHAIESGFLRGGQRALVKTGVAMQIPNGYAGMICARSGLALKHGITVLNAPGIIDA
ncbi:MAG: dUTP diphosphatase, partial [Aestuariivirga sp.]